MIIDAATDSLTSSAGWARPAREQIQQLRSYPAALIADAQQRMNVMHSSIRLVTQGLTMAGAVLPLTTREGDNLAIHRALDDARPGDVLVINGMGETSRACFGGILGELCISRNIAGVVIDGATRDVDELREMGLPVFARGITPAGPFKAGPGTIGAPAACGNVVCHPGDAVFGDSDGVVVVPKNQLDDALRLTQAQARTEETIRSRITAQPVVQASENPS